MDKIVPGCYIIAVSGGVDSMVLLDMARRQAGLRLVVAHVDHGIRADATKDTQLVAAYAARYHLPFKTVQLHLGASASEEVARKGRYEFLQRCCKKENADGILLAHHQDDVIETALIAIIRGTGWRGLAPFVGGQKVLRPLLGIAKNQLIAYARAHQLTWREDTTNSDERYLRNYVRHTVVPTLDQKMSDWEAKFLQHIRKQQEVRREIEKELAIWLDKHADLTTAGLALRRYDLIMLPQAVAYEVLQQAFRRILGHSLERPLAEGAVLFTKVSKPHKLMELNQNWQLKAESANVIVVPRTPW